MRKWHYFYGMASLLIVGLGQIIEGESKKGLQIILLVYLAVPLAVFSSLTISGYLFLMVLGISSLFAISVWGYSVWEALTYKT
ncbi:MAG: hypothetical protein QME05_01950 [Candidatus Margulisbacteria bacterium]|nr:hypothetical protein [Candidatus Margulisiibacteriota bacterium]